MEEVISSVTSSEDNGKSGLWEAESDCQHERETQRGRVHVLRFNTGGLSKDPIPRSQQLLRRPHYKFGFAEILVLEGTLFLKQTCNQLSSHTVFIHGRPCWRHIPIRKRRQPQQARTETSCTAHKITFLTKKLLRLRVSQFSQAHLIPSTTAHTQSDPPSPAPQDPLPSHQA